MPHSGVRTQTQNGHAQSTLTHTRTHAHMHGEYPFHNAESTKIDLKSKRKTFLRIVMCMHDGKIRAISAPYHEKSAAQMFMVLWVTHGHPRGAKCKTVLILQSCHHKFLFFYPGPSW